MTSKKYLLNDFKNQISFGIYKASLKNNTLRIFGDTSFVYGLGERFNSVNQIGLQPKNKVVEQFCNQGEETYLPLPFFMLEHNVGVFINTKGILTYDFEQTIDITFESLENSTEVYLFEGTYQEILGEFITLTGGALEPPKWIFGPWMSAHRWNSQKMIEEQIRQIESLSIPITALVIEQWSDEATFYAFNKAKYTPSEQFLQYEDYSFAEDQPWYNPKLMIQQLKSKGIHTLLWQAPVVKALESHEKENPQHTIDQAYLIKNNMVVKTDHQPYHIPTGKWFQHSMIPDYTNPALKEWLFNKRKYLLDIGISGFKTDGGEFIHDQNTTFYSGETGHQMVNDYARTYEATYKDFLNDDQILFSRAGYIGQQKNTITWAGDQKSTWSELRSVYNAALSSALSGQHLWSFDIGGFAGDMPSFELYLRATQLSVFVPVMQFHSEPIGGQFALLDPSEIRNNERSPWNITNYHQAETSLPLLTELYYLRMNLLPYIYSELLKAIKHKKTLLKHMMIDYPDDKHIHSVNHQHLFGDLLIVPILHQNQASQEVYFPKGTWYNIFTNQSYEGQQTHTIDVTPTQILAFIPAGKGLIIQGEDFFQKVSNSLNPQEFTLRLYGIRGSFSYDDKNHQFHVTWTNNQSKITGNTPAKINILHI